MKKQKPHAQSVESPLYLDWCSRSAAEYACQKWHYSACLPGGKAVYVGAWELGEFIGAVVFNIGAGNATDGRPYGLRQRWQVSQLARVALKTHQTPTSKIVSIALRMSRAHSPNLQACVSFADESQGHLGVLYQAMNWYYLGSRPTRSAYIVNGRKVHSRTLSDAGTIARIRQTVDPNVHSVFTGYKHKYFYAFSPSMRSWAEQHKKPYPKRAAGVDGDTSVNHAEEGGSIPTAALSGKLQ